MPLDAAAEGLADGVEAALPAWVVHGVERLAVAYFGRVEPAVRADAEAAGRRAADEVGTEVRSLLAADVDAQRTTPLSLVRAAVRYPTGVLRAAGVPGVVRDAYDESHFPDDDYGLTPMSLSELDPELQERWIVWGATKAQAHIARHGGGRS